MSFSVSESLFAQRRPISVSELTLEIKTLIERGFADLWVEGEISNFKRHSSGHWYFTLKDSGASIRAACFRMNNYYIRFLPEDGMAVRVRGRLSVYEPRGEYQLLVEFIEPIGIGALQLAFEQMRNRLAAEGFFDPERKRPLPLLPRKIGVVTSPAGAAIRDILRVLKRRNESIDILIAPARVQGDGAAEEIARSIEMLNECDDVDVIIIGRGGGSIEDLWAFNEEIVARAIFNSRIPVISAVGHETDFTIADFVADLRAPTPSAAAEQVATARDELCARMQGLATDLRRAMQIRLMELRARVSDLTSSRAFSDTRSKLYTLSQKLDECAYRMESALRRNLQNNCARQSEIERRLAAVDLRRILANRKAAAQIYESRLSAAARSALDAARQRFAVAASKLDALSPLSVLIRGYAIVWDEAGEIVKRADQVRSGERLRVKVAEGEINCVKQ